MDKTEFLSILQESLEGNISRTDIEENLQYYRSYFEQSGRSEEEVCEELGDPRLIARTIIDACIASKGPMAEHYQSQVRSEFHNEQGGQGHGGFSEEQDGYTAMTWKEKLLFAVIAVAVVIALIIIANVAALIFFRIILPLVIAFLVVSLVLRFINGSGR